jgi:4-oxalocrotonate tautomerase
VLSQDAGLAERCFAWNGNHHDLRKLACHSKHLSPESAKSNDFLIPSQSIPDSNPVSLHCGKNPNQKVERNQTMPLIQVKLIEDVFTPAQKKEMITKLTDAMVAIEGENMRSVTWVIIEDVRSGEWGIGGQALTTQAVQALAAGKS